MLVKIVLRGTTKRGKETCSEIAQCASDHQSLLKEALQTACTETNLLLHIELAASCSASVNNCDNSRPGFN